MRPDDDMTLDWTTAIADHSSPTLVERLLSAIAKGSAAAGAKLRQRRLERAVLRLSARGSPDFNNHLRKDIGLPILTPVDVDLYR